MRRLLNLLENLIGKIRLLEKLGISRGEEDREDRDEEDRGEEDREDRDEEDRGEEDREDRDEEDRDEEDRGEIRGGY